MAAEIDSDTLAATEGLRLTARAAEAVGDFDRALGHYRALTQVDPTNPRWALDQVRVLRKSKREEEATTTLRAALRRWPGVTNDEVFKDALPNLAKADKAQQALGDDLPGDEALKRDLVTDDDNADVIIGQGGRKAAVLIFTGLADRMVMPLPLFDRYLAELDLTSVFLRDRKRIGFFNGVSSLGDYDKTISSLRFQLAERGIDTIHTIGNSAGGMAAVSYGLDLGAREVLGFSAPVALTRTAANIDRRTAVFADRVLSGSVPAERRDFRTRIETATGDTRIRLYYGEEMPEDRYHAATLEGARNVSLHPLSGLAGHGALFSMAQSGTLRALFREAFGEAD